MYRHIIAAAACIVLTDSVLAQEDDDPFTQDELQVVSDPFEPVNRVVYRFNEIFDDYVAEPVARGYDRVAPEPVKIGVANFFDNLGYPVVIVSDLLQGRLLDAGADTARLLVNTTVGVLGFFDVASHFDLVERKEDLGQALGRWGLGSGPYLVLPFLGPSNLRDTVGTVGTFYVHPMYYIEGPGARNAFIVANALDYRYGLLEAGDVLSEAALDPYAFVRESYSQNRVKAVAR